MQKKFLLVLSLFSSQALECAEAPEAPEGGAAAAAEENMDNILGTFTIESDPATGASVWKRIKEDPIHMPSKNRSHILTKSNIADHASKELDTGKRVAEKLKADTSVTLTDEMSSLALINKAKYEITSDFGTFIFDDKAMNQLMSKFKTLSIDKVTLLSRFFANCCITKTLSTPALELPCDRSMHSPVAKQPLALTAAAIQVPTEADLLHHKISMQFHEYAIAQVVGRETYEYPDPDKILSEISSLYKELELKFGKDSKEYKFEPAPITLEKIHISGSKIITINPPEDLKVKQRRRSRLMNFDHMDHDLNEFDNEFDLVKLLSMMKEEIQRTTRVQALRQPSLIVHEDTAVNPDAADINPDTEGGAAAAAVATGEDQEEMGSTFPLPTRPTGASTIKTDPATGASVWRSAKEDPMFTHARRRRGIQAELNAVDRAFIELEARKRAAEALDDKELAAKELEAVSIAREELDVRRIHAQIDARAVTMEDARRKQIALKSARRKRIAEEQRARELADEELSLRQLAEHSKGLTFEFSQEPRAAFDRAQEARANCSDVFEASSECLTGFFEFVADKERQKESHLKAAKKPGRSTDADAADENSETED